MVGRQTPFLALIVPLILVGMVDGRRGVRQTWPAAVVGGLTFAVAQFACSNYISVELTDIVASLLATGAIVALLRVWQPGRAAAWPRPPPGARRARRSPARPCTTPRWSARCARRDDTRPRLAGDVLARLRAVPDHHRRLLASRRSRPIKDALAEAPWTTTFDWPGLDVVNPNGEALASRHVQLQLAARGGHAAADLRPDHDGRARDLPRPRAARLRATLDQLKWAILTVAVRARRSPT